MKRVFRLLFLSTLLPAMASVLTSQCVAQNAVIADPDIIVRISWPGVSAESMRTSVSEPAADLMRDNSDLSVISTVSGDGFSLILLHRNAKQADGRMLIQSIRFRLQNLTLPKGSKPPVIEPQLKRNARKTRVHFT
jgi:multidrug efflux pump subunit AcrB